MSSSTAVDGGELSRVGPIQYSSKSDIVCAMLRELIISGEISASEQLRQRDLAMRFGVSQTPVREALRRLESEGLVVNDPHRGATVVESQGGVIHDNSRIRAALETLGARMAARSITQEQAEQLVSLNQQMAELGEDEDSSYGELNREFHFVVYSAAHSPMLLSMMRLLWQAMPDGPKVTRSHGESVAQHDELIEALRQGNADTAAEVMQRHILGTSHLDSEITHS